MNERSIYTILESYNLRNLEDQIHDFIAEHSKILNMRFKVFNISYSTTTIQDKIHYSALLSHSQLPSDSD